MTKPIGSFRYYANTPIKEEKSTKFQTLPRGELSYLAPLGSENISAPYLKQCFFWGGGITPQD